MGRYTTLGTNKPESPLSRMKNGCMTNGLLAPTAAAVGGGGVPVSTPAPPLTGDKSDDETVVEVPAAALEASPVVKPVLRLSGDFWRSSLCCKKSFEENLKRQITYKKYQPVWS